VPNRGLSLLLAVGPQAPAGLAFDYRIGDVSDGEGARPVTGLRPKLVKSGAGENLEYRFTLLDGKPDVRRYGLVDGQWASIP